MIILDAERIFVISSVWSIMIKSVFFLQISLYYYKIQNICTYVMNKLQNSFIKSKSPWHKVALCFED